MHLFEPLQIRDVQFRNRIAISPMCQYSCVGGLANTWHLVHLGSRAVGGAGLVIAEASAVVPEGRISPDDLGIWSDAHAEALAPAARFIREQGSVAGIQLAHAGRKASTHRPWGGSGPVDESAGGWRPIYGPSPIPFNEAYPTPEELTVEGIRRVVTAFADSARRSREAGFQVVEIHGAHGYLLHEFVSPLSNHRTDAYGGSFENRTRIVREVVEAVRGEWPEHLPLFLRISATDWAEGGWDLEQSVVLSRQVKALGVDLIDCSSGALIDNSKSIPAGPGYQTPFAERIRRETGILTGAVGLITSPHQADHIVRTGQADLVLLARELLRDPYWPLRAAHALHKQGPWPPQYERAKW
jgi:2,4-dienoyl-CoA reductase-like NADH-dependent reductase (Old Yellow Enzyme family)